MRSQRNPRHGGLVVLTLLMAGQAAAAEKSGEWRISDTIPEVTLSARVWETDGETTWDHNASALDPTVGNPTSRLKYQNIDSTVFEIKGRVELPQRFFVELAHGRGDIDDGSLVDEDFLSALGSQAFGATVPGEHLFSQTVSEIDGEDLRYYDFVFGRQVFRSADAGTSFSLFGRFLDWSEKYRATGLFQSVCTAPFTLCAPVGSSGFAGTNVIFNDVDWEAVFIGIDGSHRFGNRIAISGRLAWSPRAELNNTDIHFLRGDLEQNPSFRMNGTGQAYSADLNADFAITAALSAHLGFRYWKMDVEGEADGWTTFPRGSAPVSAELKNFETERKGVTLGLSYAWGARSETE